MSLTPPSTPRQPVLLVVGGIAPSLIAFRGPLLEEMIRRGWRVIAAAGNEDAETTTALAQRGIEFVRLPLNRTGMNPFTDITTLNALLALMRRVKPDVFLGYTVKPVAYGLIAARLSRVPRRVGMLEGLGYAFTEGTGAKRRLARLAVTASLRLSLGLAHRVIFLNRDDRDWFVRRRLVRYERTALVSGAGVDLAHYAPAPLPDPPATFVMIARLLRDKGLHEYTAAARMVKRDFPEARFVLVGPIDANPAAVKPSEVEAWVREGVIEYRGELRDVRPEIARCHVYVLPSYREGMPRTVLEAMAMGRAIITTDVPGCRETVIDGWNGRLVPARDAAALADACKQLMDAPEFIRLAGARSVELCRQHFDARNVVNATVAILLGQDNSDAASETPGEHGRTGPASRSQR